MVAGMDISVKQISIVAFIFFVFSVVTWLYIPIISAATSTYTGLVGENLAHAINIVYAVPSDRDVTMLLTQTKGSFVVYFPDDQNGTFVIESIDDRGSTNKTTHTSHIFKDIIVDVNDSLKNRRFLFCWDDLKDGGFVPSEVENFLKYEFNIKGLDNAKVVKTGNKFEIKNNITSTEGKNLLATLATIDYFDNYIVVTFNEKKNSYNLTSINNCSNMVYKSYLGMNIAVCPPGTQEYQTGLVNGKGKCSGGNKNCFALNRTCKYAKEVLTEALRNKKDELEKINRSDENSIINAFIAGATIQWDVMNVIKDNVVIDPDQYNKLCGECYSQISLSNKSAAFIFYKYVCIKKEKNNASGETDHKIELYYPTGGKC